ncbi:MAG: hypothetical protein V4678_03520 [Patescibacteria group bacterium]
MKRTKTKTLLAKLLLGIGYFSLLLQWFWMLTIALPPLIRSGVLDSFVMTPATERAAQTGVPIEVSPLVAIFVGLVTLIILIITVIVIIKTPRVVVRTSERVVHRAVDAVVPVITHHHVLPQKKRRVLSRRVALAVRLLFTLVPVVVCLFLPSLDELTKQIIITIALWLGAVSTLAFVAAWLIEPQKTISQTRSHASRE